MEKDLDDLLKSVSEAGDEDGETKTADIEKLSEDELVDLLKDEFGGEEVKKLAGALEDIAEVDAEMEAVRPLQKVAELVSTAEILSKEGVIQNGVDQNGSGAT